MKVSVKIGNRERHVELAKRNERMQFQLDGKIIAADAVEVAPRIYSVLLDGMAFETRVESKTEALRVHVDGREYHVEILDPRRWRRDRSKTAPAEGRQQVVAPMPGKIVRVLVKTGEAVEAGQGLMVVEAMKMQNEIKSPKLGAVERLMVREGQAVNSGEALAIIA